MGSLPSSSIEEYLGSKYVTINSGVNALWNDMRFAMSYCAQHNPAVLGFNVPFTCLEHYLTDNVVVESDKDGALVLISKRA